MHENDMAKIFDLIHEFGLLDREDLRKKFSKENLDLLNSVAPILIEGEAPEIKDSNDFVEYVYMLKKAKSEGSKNLSIALINSRRELDAGNRVAAEGILDNFIGSCRSKFYTDIAKEQKKNMGRVNP